MKTSPLFTPVALKGKNRCVAGLTLEECPGGLHENRGSIPAGDQVYHGIPFDFGADLAYAAAPDTTVSLDAGGVSARWLVFAHTCVPDNKAFKTHGGFHEICKYRVKFADGETAVLPIRYRMETGMPEPSWGHDPYLCVQNLGHKAVPMGRDFNEQDWGNKQTRVEKAQNPWTDWYIWLHAWENPRPDAAISGIDIIPVSGRMFLMAVTAGDVSANPLRHQRRAKARMKLDSRGDGKPFDLLDIDMGTVISVQPRPTYDHIGWETNGWDVTPGKGDEYLIEYAAHADALLYPAGQSPIAVRDLDGTGDMRVAAAEHKVTLRVTDHFGRPTPFRVHAHGVAGEYLPPRNTHRIPNHYWFQDYGVDHVQNRGVPVNHNSCYIDGTAEYLLPLGEVFFEISKGFEMAPIRTRFDITPETGEIVIKIERTLDWRALGWVTADTHVHFISPTTALLESEAEGVNVVNLLASQWGELFTNIGDFTGRDLVSPNKEHIVRVGTENRQHMLGHISLLGYDAPMILPLTTGGPDESALGDPVETTLSEWARRCREQSGVNIIPHFPFPSGEAYAALVSNLIDGVEATFGIGNLFLANWYRFLNCGYHVAGVGGTDKMNARTAIGAARTYAKIDGPFTYDAWKGAIKAGRTFISCGALIDMDIEGAGPGGNLGVKAGSTVTINWKAASAVVPITCVELVINGETADTTGFDGFLGTREGSFRAAIPGSSWIALRVRGRVKDDRDVITAHTSAVMAIINGQPVFNTTDAVAVLEQIEGVKAYIKNIGTKAREDDYKRMLLSLNSAYTALHDRLHMQNSMHTHSPADKHEGH